MVLIRSQTEKQPIPYLDFSGIQITRTQFQQLCEANPDLRLELNRHGELIVMAPTFGISGGRNANLIIQVGIWNNHANRRNL